MSDSATAALQPCAYARRRLRRATAASLRHPTGAGSARTWPRGDAAFLASSAGATV